MNFMTKRIVKKEKAREAAERFNFIVKLGEKTLLNLLRLHGRDSSSGEIKSAMIAFYGFPHKCLICGEKVKWSSEDNLMDDIDGWFCNGCCPICNTIR